MQSCSIGDGGGDVDAADTLDELDADEQLLDDLE